GHGFKNNQWVLISGATPASFNGIYQINTVTTNTFKYTGGTSGTVSGTISAVVVKAPMQLSLTRYFKHTYNGISVHPVADTAVYRSTDDFGASTGRENDRYTESLDHGTASVGTQAIAGPKPVV